jgi:ATP phosphoribosyltransferase regulatory subunit
MKSDSSKGLLPAGLADDLPPEADIEAETVTSLMATFRAHGYERVKPPLIEFEESLLEGPGAALAQQLFRVMDPQSQRMLGLRADMTVQVARIAATRLGARPRPLRLSYSGQVLRTRGSQLRPERQFSQAGFELIGSDSLEADLEAILLAAEALQGAGAKNLSIDLTVPHLVGVLAAEAGIKGERLAQLRDALDRKDAAALATVAGQGSTDFQRLLGVSGPVDEAITGLKAMALSDAAGAIISSVEALVVLAKPHMGDMLLTLDPTEYRGFEYHTGVSFSVFARGVRGELGRGGRYLLQDDEPATGFSVYLDSLRRALPSQGNGNRVFVTDVEGFGATKSLHDEGWRTIRGLINGADALAEAHRLGCTHVFLDGTVQALEATTKKSEKT